MEESFSDVSSILSFLSNEVDSFRETNCVQGIKISSHHHQLSSKDTDIHQLKHEIRLLKAKLFTFERLVQDSQNSSIPPYKESLKAQSIKRTRSLREKSDNHFGGHIGHKGHTLEFSSTPAVIIEHTQEYCTHYGCSLTEIQAVENRSAQVTELTETKSIMTEYRFFAKQCTCGHKNKVYFQIEVPAYTCYGQRMRAHISYLNIVQCIPFDRLCGLFEECCNVKPSQWTWVWQISSLTFVHQSASREMLAIDQRFPNGLLYSTQATDRHSSYFKMIVKDQQRSLDHPTRNLIYVTKLEENQTWSNRLNELLKEAIHKLKTIDRKTISRQSLFQSLERQFEEPLEKLHEDIQKLKKSLLKQRDHILLFLSNQDIPYDNKDSGRAIRLIKVKKKISGCFKSVSGAFTIVQLHSISDTAPKNGKSRYQALLSAAIHEAEVACL